MMDNSMAGWFALLFQRSIYHISVSDNDNNSHGNHDQQKWSRLPWIVWYAFP